MIAATTWPDVGLALVTIIPGTIAAFFAYLAAAHSRHNRESLKTPSKTSIGQQVEDALHTTIANNYRLQALGKGFDVPMPDKAAAEEARVEALNTVQTRQERAENG